MSHITPVFLFSYFSVSLQTIPCEQQATTIWFSEIPSGVTTVDLCNENYLPLSTDEKQSELTIDESYLLERMYKSEEV